MNFREIGSDAVASQQQQSAADEIEDAELSRRMSRRDDHTDKRSELMDSYCKETVLNDQDFIPNLRKNELALMSEGHEQPHSRFDVDEHLEVQLRFDLGSLVEAQMMLDNNGPRDSHWDFIQHEQSGLGFQASSEENVSFMSHQVKQHEVKAYDNCEGWPRSSSSQVDAQLFLDAQDDVRMITDVFGEKGRNVEDRAAADIEPRLVSYEHHAEATAWVDLSGKKQLQAKVCSDKEFDYKNHEEDRLHAQFDHEKTIQTSWFAINKNSTKAGSVDTCEGRIPVTEYRTPTLENATDKILRENEPVILADLIGQTTENEEVGDSVLQTVQEEETEQAMQLKTQVEVEPPLKADPNRSEERSTTQEDCIKETSSPNVLGGEGSSQEAVLDCGKTLPMDTKILSPNYSNIEDQKHKTCDKLSNAETEEFEQSVEEVCFQEHAHKNTLAIEHVMSPSIGSEKKTEERHDSSPEAMPFSCSANVPTTQSVASSLVTIRPDETVRGLPTAVEDVDPVCASPDRNIQASESKINESHNYESISESLGDLVGQAMTEESAGALPNVDNIINKLQEGKSVQDVTVTSIDVMEYQEHVLPASKAEFESQRLQGMPEPWEINTSMDRMKVDELVTNDSRGNLSDAQSLEEHTISEVSKAVVPEKPGISDKSETVQPEKDMPGQGLGSVVELSGNFAESAGVVSDKVQECLVGTDSLEGPVVTKIPTQAVLKDPDVGGIFETVQIEKEINKQHLESGMEVCENSAGLTRSGSGNVQECVVGSDTVEGLESIRVPTVAVLGNSDISDNAENDMARHQCGSGEVCTEETDTGKSMVQKQLTADMETNPGGHDLVASVSCENLASDTFVAEKDASPVINQIGVNVSAGKKLQSDLQVACTEGLGSTQRLSNPEISLAVSEGIDHASANALTHLAAEQACTTQQSDNLISASAGDDRISNVAVPISENRTLDFEVEGVQNNESKDAMTKQGVAEKLVGGTQEMPEDIKVDDATEQGGAENQRHLVAGQVSDVSDSQITSATEYSGSSFTVNTAEGQNDLSAGTLLTDANTSMDSSPRVDVDMEDVQEAELKMNRSEREKKNVDSNLEVASEVFPAMSVVVHAEELPEAKLLRNSEENMHVCTSQRSTGVVLGSLVHVSRDVENLDEHAKDGIKEKNDDRDQFSRQETGAVEPPSAEPGDSASEEIQTKVNEALLDEDRSSVVSFKEHEDAKDIGDTINQVGHSETLGEEKQTSSPAASMEPDLEAGGSAAKPDIFDDKAVTTSDQVSSQLGGSIHVAVSVSCTETQSAPDGRQVSNVVSSGPHVKNQEDCPEQGVAINDGEVGSRDAVRNSSILQKMTNDQSKDIEVLSSEVTCVDSEATEKLDVTDARTPRTSKEQVNTGCIVNPASSSTVMAFYISASDALERQKGPKSKIASLKGVEIVNAGEQNAGIRHTISIPKNAEKRNTGAAMCSTELPLPKSKSIVSSKSQDRQDVDTRMGRNTGTSQAPVMSDEDHVSFQNISVDGVTKHRSGSAVLINSNRKLSSQTRNKVAGLNEEGRAVGVSDLKRVSFSDHGKKKSLMSMVRDGKSQLQTSDAVGLSPRKTMDVPVSGVQDSLVLMQASDKVERCLDVSDPQALTGAVKSSGKSLLTNNGPSTQNRVLEGKDGPSLSMAASSAVAENLPTPVKLNQPTLLANPRQQTSLPDLNVAEIVPSALPSQPFTDSQQVQLRAQILVYGSLIQGTLPEEALMMAAFSDITGARWEAGRDSAGGGRAFWERSWRAAAERVQNRSLLNTPRDPSQGVAQSIGVGLSGLTSVATTRTSEDGVRANGSSVNSGPGAATVDARNIPLLNTKFSDTFGSKVQSTRPRPSGAASTDKTGSRSNPPGILNAPRVPATSGPIRVLPSMLSESLATPQSSRPTLDAQQLPARTFFPTPQLGPFLPGSSHWISPPPFPGPWMSQPPQGGFDVSVSFSHTQSVPSSDAAQEMTGTRKTTSFSRGPFAPVIPSLPSFSPSVTVSMPILTTATSDAGSVQRNNAVPSRSLVLDSTSRKRKKNQSEPLRMLTQSEPSRMPMDMVAPASLSLSSPETVPAAGNRTTAAFSLPLRISASHQNVSLSSSPPSLPAFTSSESLAMVVASTQVSPSSVAETSRPLLSIAQTSIPLLTNVLGVPSPTSTAEHQLVPRQEHQDRSMLLENLEQAKASAEEASSLAASAVRESEAVWSQLQVNHSSGAVSDAEMQLVSSAIAMATAASVAKAAAASARVAYEAALQAKAMRDEALGSSNEAWKSNSSGGFSSEKLSLLTPQLPDEIDNSLSQTWQMPMNCRSIIATAKRASKKRLEAVSAAKLRAQNIDSVVRAAELAAAAVSQVGAVVAMGDSIPFTLDMLVEAGPEGFHRLEGVGSPLLLHEKARNNQEGTGVKSLTAQLMKENDMNLVTKVHGALKESIVQGEGDKENQSIEPHLEGAQDFLKNHESAAYREIDNVSMGHTSKEAGISDLSGRGMQPSMSKKESRLSVEAEFNSRKEQGAPAPANRIVKDSIVEVLSDEDGLRGVWFSARVLNVEGGKVLVLYDELLSDDGPDPLEEWIDLDGAPGQAPRVRLAHPITNVSFEGTRKRRRAAMGNHKWSVGDRVDALIKDGWWEGEILDISEEAEGKAKVFFPGEGDTANIKTLNLRPSLVWTNGQWVLWTDIKQENSRVLESSLAAHQGETPATKRQKTERDQTMDSSRVKEKIIEANLGERLAVSSHVEELLLDRTMKGNRDGGHSVVDERARDIPMKEGSKVVFGVPKPTKKRKFIEVSKHYASNRVTRSSPEGKASGKHDNHKLSALQFRMGFAGTTKIDVTKTKKKLPSVETFQAKSSVLKNEREKSSSGFGMGLWKDTSARVGLSSGPQNWEGKLVNKKVPSVGNKAESQRSSGNVPLTLPREATLPKLQAPLKRYGIGVELESLGNEKTPSQLSKGNEKDKDQGKLVTDISEPRRSSRKIQPTSKLLEGLQSAPKLGKNASSSSHDKGSRGPPKNVVTTMKGLPSSQKQ